MKILDRLPYLDRPSLLCFSNGTVEIRAFQIVVWLRIQKLAFPAILDTGHSHNFSIPERLLKTWAGIDSPPEIGRVEVNRQPMSQFDAELWIHKNRRGTREPTAVAFQLKVEQGITVVPDETPSAPRLPVLGLRAMTASRLRLVIDGKRRLVSLGRRWL